MTCVFPMKVTNVWQVTVESVTEKLRGIDKSKADGPDGLPAWLLKTYADIMVNNSRCGLLYTQHLLTRN